LRRLASLAAELAVKPLVLDGARELAGFGDPSKPRHLDGSPGLGRGLAGAEKSVMARTRPKLAPATSESPDVERAGWTSSVTTGPRPGRDATR